MTVLTFINLPSQKGQESGTAINMTKTKTKIYTKLIYKTIVYFDGLEQERHNSFANTLELCLSWTNLLV